MKHLGKHPCLRCYVKKDQIGQLGTEADEKLRVEQTRVDDRQRRQVIQAARKLILERRCHVGNAQVARLLDERSLTPIEVGIPSYAS